MISQFLPQHGNPESMNSQERPPAPLRNPKGNRKPDSSEVAPKDLPPQSSHCLGKVLDGLVRIAAHSTDSTWAALSLLDNDLLLLGSSHGDFPGKIFSRADAGLCNRVLGEGTYVEVSRDRKKKNLTESERVCHMKVDHFAGVPLRSPEGISAGILFVMDQNPKTLSETQIKTLSEIALLAQNLIFQTDCIPTESPKQQPPKTNPMEEAKQNSEPPKPIAGTTTAAPVRNKNDIRSEFELDPVVATLLQEYVPTLMSNVRDMVISHEIGNWEPIRLTAQRIRGTAGMYGFQQISEAAGTLEEAILTGHNGQHLRSLMDELTQLVGRVTV